MKRLVTAASALAIAVTSMVATPAAAQNNRDRNAIGLVLGLATIGIIANELDKKRDRENDDDDDKASRNNNYYYNDRHDGRHGKGHGRDDWRHDGRHDDRHGNRGNQGVDRRWLIPERCVVETRNNNRRSSVVSEDCFRRVQRADLPNQCEFDIRTDRGRQEVFGLNCLLDRGYRLARI